MAGGFVLDCKSIPCLPPILDVIAYLTSKYDRSLQYTSIAAAKSVLVGVLHIPGVTSISSHPLIIGLLKGTFHVRPPKPRYEFIWDTDLVLKSLKTLHSEDSSPLDFIVRAAGEHTPPVSTVSTAA